jgi:hypothetical protein
MLLPFRIAPVGEVRALALSFQAAGKNTHDLCSGTLVHNSHVLEILKHIGNAVLSSYLERSAGTGCGRPHSFARERFIREVFQHKFVFISSRFEHSFGYDSATGMPMPTFGNHRNSFGPIRGPEGRATT